MHENSFCRVSPTIWTNDERLTKIFYPNGLIGCATFWTSLLVPIIFQVWATRYPHTEKKKIRLLVRLGKSICIEYSTMQTASTPTKIEMFLLSFGLRHHGDRTPVTPWNKSSSPTNTKVGMIHARNSAFRCPSDPWLARFQDDQISTLSELQQ